MSGIRISSRAEVATESPDRYARQLVSHLGRKVAFTTDGTTSTATIGTATADVVIGDGVLILRAAGSEEQGVALVERVLGDHLERFGRRHELTVRWTRTTTTGTATTNPEETS